MAQSNKDLHYKLLASISDYMNEDVGNLPKFKAKLSSMLPPVDIADNKSIHDVLSAMERKGCLMIGEYKHLKYALGKDNVNIIKMVEEVEENMGIKPANNDGISSASSQVENDADFKQRNKRMHAELIANIGDHLSHEVGNLERFKANLKAKLNPTQLSKDKTFLDVRKALESTGLLGVGEYGVLKDAVEGVDYTVLNMIKKAEEKIEENTKLLTDSIQIQKRKSNASDDFSSASSTKKQRTTSEVDGGSDGIIIQDRNDNNTENFPGEKFRKVEEAALPYEEIHDIVKEEIWKRIGSIDIGGCQGTGFRVGKDLILSAYHVFKPRIDDAWKGLAHKICNILDKGNDKKYIASLAAAFAEVHVDVQEEQIDKLQLATEYINKWRKSTTPEKMFTDLKDVFDDHKTLPNDIERYLKGLSDTGTITFGKFKKKPGQELVTFQLSLDLPFHSEPEDVILVRLINDPSKPMPPPFLLDNTLISPRMHLVGHPNDKVLQFDPGCEVYTNQQELEKDVEEARNYCLPKCKDDNSRRILKEDYKVMVDNFNRRKCIVFHCSRTIAHGASGSPGIVVDNSEVKVQAMLQRGHPGIVYNALSKDEIDKLPAKCLFESGLSMVRLQSLLKYKETEAILKEIFNHDDTLQSQDSMEI